MLIVLIIRHLLKIAILSVNHALIMQISPSNSKNRYLFVTCITLLKGVDSDITERCYIDFIDFKRVPTFALPRVKDNRLTGAVFLCLCNLYLKE